ncbi:MAG TPA: DUF2182 domain-containing protein [Rhizomicrobium sp.]|nr:DUF2182 domain-containing protein [Rhizomicrobium sp.]
MAPDRRFFTASLLVFLGSAVVTIIGCQAMPMPHGGAMATAGVDWPATALSFLVMWLMMMAAMMLPSLAPMLMRYRLAVGATGLRLDGLTALAGAGYFSIWVLLGVAVLAFQTALTVLEARLPLVGHAIPLAATLAILIASAYQFSAAKARALACCRYAPVRIQADMMTAWRHGLDLGLRCAACCANLMAILLVIGMMDLRAMIAVTAAITAERLMPGRQRVAHAIGAAALVAGLFLTMRTFVL